VAAGAFAGASGSHRQTLPSLCDLVHIWNSPLLLVCKHANRGNKLRGTGISSWWHADDRNHDLDCCSGSPGQPSVAKSLSGRLLRQAGQRQLRHVGNIIVGETAAHSQHGADPFQENRTPLDRQTVGSGHHDFQLRVGQANHDGRITRPKFQTNDRPPVVLFIKKILTMQHKNERIGGADLDWRITQC